MFINANMYILLLVYGHARRTAIIVMVNICFEIRIYIDLNRSGDHVLVCQSKCISSPKQLRDVCISRQSILDLSVNEMASIKTNLSEKHASRRLTFKR